MNEPSRFHSVFFDDESCNGCTTCVMSCPVEAIRVRNGKASILEERCIDCGECIRRCPHHAKRALAASLSQLEEYDEAVLLVPPSFYAQFEEKYSIAVIQVALLSLGFSFLYDVSDFSSDVSLATADYLCEKNIQRPVLSSSCPAIIKLIQIRFPSLIENILPVLPPVEIAARYAASVPFENTEKERLRGIFFISPCPAKITVPRLPPGYEESKINGAFSMSEMYLPVLNAIKTGAKPNSGAVVVHRQTDFPQSYKWGMSDGEIDMLHRTRGEKEPLSWISCSGITHTLQILESIEEGKLRSVDYVEASICSGGCIGGSLAVTPMPIAHAVMRNRLVARKDFEEQKTDEESSSAADDFSRMKNIPRQKDCRWTKDIIPRPALLLSSDFKKARHMMVEIDELVSQLPGLNCGSCGSPNCRSLAEDIVRHQAKKEDCIQILKKKYDALFSGYSHE